MASPKNTNPQANRTVMALTDQGQGFVHVKLKALHEWGEQITIPLERARELSVGDEVDIQITVKRRRES